MLSLLVLIPFVWLILLVLPAGNGVAFVRRVGFVGTVILSIIQMALVLIDPFTRWSLAPDFVTGMFKFALHADSLSTVVLLSIGLVVFTALFVGRYTLKNAVRFDQFVLLTVVVLMGMNATVLVTDMFSLYVFIELTAVASFMLIALNTDDKFGIEGSFKYLILSTVATVLMLSSIALMFLTTGDVKFDVVSVIAKHNDTAFYIKLATALFLCGTFIKAGVVPFHGWVPDAYSAAPSAVSVLLGGIVTKVAGVYVMIRLMTTVFGLTIFTHNVIMLFGTVSILVGAFAALGQNDMKRMLAYSSISQIGYIILGLGCGTPLAVAGAVFHFFNHAVFKSLLFVNSAAVEHELGNFDMSKMGGLSQKMPVTSFTNIVALLSTAGVPPLSGFWSKVIIIIALWLSGQKVYAGIAVIASVVTLAYFLLMQRKTFYGQLVPGMENVKEAGMDILIPEVVLTVIIIVTGILLPFVLNNFVLLTANLVR